jgi:hypothetical protein
MLRPSTSATIRQVLGVLSSRYFVWRGAPSAQSEQPLKPFGPISNQDSVPAWRDGAAGKSLQKAMIDVCRRRLFDHGGLDVCISGNRPVFSSGTSWSAFARLAGPPHHHIDAVIERVFDTKNAWTDSVKNLHRFGADLLASRQLGDKSRVGTSVRVVGPMGVICLEGVLLLPGPGSE